MPFELNRHTIPHLKALTCSIEHAIGKGRCSPFTIYQNTSLKELNLFHTEANERKLLQGAVMYVQSTFYSEKKNQKFKDST